MVFCSSDLPAKLDDDARFALWRDIYAARHGESDFTREPDGPFFARSEFVPVGAAVLTRFDASFRRWARTARQVAADARDDFMIGFNRGGNTGFIQRGREVDGAGAPGAALFFTNSEPGESYAEGRGVVTGLCLPRALLGELVANPDDQIGTVLDPGSGAVRHLERFIDFLLDADELGEDRVLANHVATALADLAALALGARRDVAELLHIRGLRAARVQAIIAEIRAGYLNPGFAVRDVARRLRLSPRYIQNLLSETGTSFVERVLELRLQQARRMLAEPRCDRLRISEIAEACGFNEVSYFNRCVRRRFGVSPSGLRGRSA